MTTEQRRAPTAPPPPLAESLTKLGRSSEYDVTKDNSGCFLCGSRDLVESVDTKGNKYMGCKRHRNLREAPTVRPPPSSLDRDKAEHVKRLRDLASYMLASANTIEDSMNLDAVKAALETR